MNQFYSNKDLWTDTEVILNVYVCPQINSVWLVEENDNDKQMRHSGRQMTAVLAYVHFSDRICSRGHLSLSSALQDEVKTVVSNEWELASELFRIKLNWLIQGQLTLSQNCIFCTKSKVEWVLQRRVRWVQCSVSSSVQWCMCSVFWRGGVGMIHDVGQNHYHKWIETTPAREPSLQAMDAQNT